MDNFVNNTKATNQYNLNGIHDHKLIISLLTHGGSHTVPCTIEKTSVSDSHKLIIFP